MEGILNFLYGEYNKIAPQNYKDVYEAASIFAIPSATTFFKHLMNDREKQKRRSVDDLNQTLLENESKSKFKNRTITEEDQDKNEASDEETVKSSRQFRNTNGNKISEHFTSPGKNMSEVPQQDISYDDRTGKESADLSPQPVVPSVQQQAVEDGKRLLTRTLPTCNVCGRRFLRIGFLKRHKERKHFKNRDKRVYKCEFCPKVCRTPKDIKLHRRRHTGQ